ncbi:MAG: Rrf2 family transcriptional regulator [Chloroflexi bacterium]|nr:Rrf2 family transcriptional regulator [Chloroflexota bacterium]
MRFWINRRTDYAIRVILGLAKYPPGTRIAAQQLSEDMLIPLSLLYSLLKDLIRAKLVKTYPGPKGGLELARPADQITLRDVIEAMDRLPQVSECVTEPGVCPFANACPVRRRWARIHRLVLRELERTTFADLVKETKQPFSTGRWEISTEV